MPTTPDNTKPLKDYPGAACPRCGGWTLSGGMSQHAKDTKPFLGRTGCICLGAKTYVFTWVGGGYNTVNAKDLREARRKVKSLETNLKAGGSTLVAFPDVHLARPGETEHLSKTYASMFD